MPATRKALTSKDDCISFWIGDFPSENALEAFNAVIRWTGVRYDPAAAARAKRPRMTFLGTFTEP